MHRFTATGINHKTAAIDLREKLSFSSDQVQEALQQFRTASHFEEVVILSTCNRVEIYGVGAGDAPIAREQIANFLSAFHGVDVLEVNPHVYHYEGALAVQHLYQVVSGLDAMALGETEILAQTKQAFALSMDLDATGKRLNSLFQKAFHVAKRVHSETKISHSKISIASVAVDFASELFSRFGNKTLLQVGAGQMGQLALKHFVETGVQSVLVTNRSFDKAKTLADEVGGSAFPLEQLAEHLHEADIVVCASASDRHIISPEIMVQALKKRRNHPIFLLDLSVPRVIHPEVQAISNAFLYDIDHLQEIVTRNMASRQDELEICLTLIEEQTQLFMNQAAEWEAEPLIADISKEVNRIRDEEWQRLKRKLQDNSTLDERLRDEIENTTRRIANKITHKQFINIRQEAKNGQGYTTVKLLRRIFFGSDKTK